jgi:hypothetical protein
MINVKSTRGTVQDQERKDGDGLVDGCGGRGEPAAGTLSSCSSVTNCMTAVLGLRPRKVA